MDKTLNSLFVASLGFALFLSAAPGGGASGLRDSAWVSAHWALAAANPQALADSLVPYLEEGGILTDGNPFCALHLIEELRAMAGGAELAQVVRAQ